MNKSGSYANCPNWQERNVTKYIERILALSHKGKNHTRTTIASQKRRGPKGKQWGGSSDA